MRCIGIDYGTRRIGLSYGDEIGVATPLPALVQTTNEQRWTALGDVVQKRSVTDLVIDERLTSFEAESSIAKSKLRDLRASGLVDSRAATIILQDFLDQRIPPALPMEEEV
jgi:putative holliday junction resolvase